MKTLILYIFALSYIAFVPLEAQTTYVFEGGTNTTLFFEEDNWQGNLIPSVVGSIMTNFVGDTIKIESFASLNTAATLINNGVLIIVSDPLDFNVLTINEIGNIRNNGIIIIEENTLLDTDDGGDIDLNPGSRTEIMGTLSKQEFASLSIQMGAIVNLSGEGLLEIF